ncbi:MAG: tRNA uridine-5-carboxymethylaminomethyl(34) synthesis GTPase MnmE [Rhodanobacteraceae bacterium]|nr:MAG: tRNA uridine-5-carboxymethylaminomethyl(34) synthesis GTPase MnmE [Rhodanobacteraceae bacterium]
MPPTSETIAAVASAPGRGGIGVVRVSGPAAHAIAKALCGSAPAPRRAHLATFVDAAGAVLDRGLALWFPAPHSFTGEDVLELHAHGSPVVLDALVRRACALGARPAQPGEFSERAFLNGKLDLAQAEAIADLIAARSEAQARAALRSLEGEFSRRVAALTRTIVRLRVEVEAAIDFADDASEGASPAALEQLFARATAELDALLAAARRGVRLTDGLRAVIVGAPNVGKSSLLNALAGSARAIVTEVPGTTRDVLRESILLEGVELTLADTAGLRDSSDRVELEGIRRARAELAMADLVLAVTVYGAAVGGLDAGESKPGAQCIKIVNKIDLADAAPWRCVTDGVVTLGVSAHTGAGLDALRAELRRMATGSAVDGDFSARTRHVVALGRAAASLAEARALAATATPELVAESLRAVQHALGEITGVFSSEDLLGAIFSTFCVGK